MTYMHIENVKVTACFSECGRYRYRLDVAKNNAQGSRCVCAIMQNPSDANEERADRSIKILELLVFKKGLEEFLDVSKIIIVNQFAYIQKSEFHGSHDHIGSENDSHIKRAIDESDIVLIAWGKTNQYEGRKKTISQIIKSAGSKILLQTKTHPSRVKYDNFITPYSIANT